jgi:LmbE family N-acetylglucosaminyl deacetylase
MHSTTPQTLLLILAHPDDESFLAAGLISAAVADGHRVVLVTATLGQAGSTGDPPVCTREELPEVRRQELLAAAGILGIAEVHVLQYRDKELATAPTAEVRTALVGLIRRCRPRIVVTFDPGGFNGHTDHVAISRFTTDALGAAADGRWVVEAGPPHVADRLLWIAPVPPWKAAACPDLAAEPGVDLVVQLGGARDRKAAAVRAHRTQWPSIRRIFFGGGKGLERGEVPPTFDLEAFRLGAGRPFPAVPARGAWEGLDPALPS